MIGVPAKHKTLDLLEGWRKKTLEYKVSKYYNTGTGIMKKNG